MQEPDVVHSTFVIERSYAKPPERVFAALADSQRKRRWFAEGESHEVEAFEMEFRAGGRERLRYRFKDGTPFAGTVVAHEGSYQDIVPNRRVVTASSMTLGGRCISASLVTIELLATATGTDMICTHQGAFFAGSDGPQIREAGWRKLFERMESELARQ